MALAAVAILTTLVIGIPIALAVDRDCRGGELIGLAYLYGCGVVWVVLFALSLLHVGWTVITATVTLMVIAAVMWGAVLRQRAVASRGVTQAFLPVHSTSADETPAALYLSLLVDATSAYTVISFAIYATIARVWEWDFWAIWGLKGRTFFEAGGIDWRFLESPFNTFAHPDYPLLLPLNYAYAALLNGQWDDRWMGLPGVAFAVALILIVRSLAARELPRLYAAVLTFAIASLALSQYVGLADAPLIAYGTAAIVFLRRGILFDDRLAFRHGSILLGLAASTKNEGLALIVSVAIAFLATRPSKWREVRHLWPAVLIPLPWLAARIAFHLPTDIAGGSWISRVVERLGDVGAVVSSLLRWLPDPWLWLLMLSGIVLIPATRRYAERFTFLVVAVQALWYLAVYFGTPLDVVWHIETSWPRVARHLEAPLLFIVMLALAQAFGRGETLAHAEARSELR